MRASAHDKAIAAVMKWAQREEWRNRLDAIIADHLEPAFEQFDLEPDELPDLLGQGGYALLIGCAFEDFVTCDFEPDCRASDWTVESASVPCHQSKRHCQPVQCNDFSIVERPRFAPRPQIVTQSFHPGVRERCRGTGRENEAAELEQPDAEAHTLACRLLQSLVHQPEPGPLEQKVSGAGGSHPRALAEPDMT
jgi:hypothetical protein